MKEDNWLEDYNEIRKLIFNFQFDIPKALKLNRCTVKLKHEVIQMEKHTEKIIFDREIERNDMYTQIRKLRQETKYLRAKIDQKEFDKMATQAQDLEKKIEKFKEIQMIVFEDMSKDEIRIEQELEIFDGKIQHYENTKNLQCSTISQGNNQFIKTTKKLCDVEEDPEQEQEEEDQNIKVGEDERDYNSHTEDIDDEFNDSIEDMIKKGVGENQDPGESKETDRIKNLINELDNKMKQNKDKVTVINNVIKQLGGVNCGWKQKDHDDFIKIKNKHKGQILKPAFQKEYQSYMAFLPAEELDKHIEKYLLYCEYEEEKKSLLQSYKTMKEDIQKHQQHILEIQADITRERVMQKEKLYDQEERKKKKEFIIQWKNQKLGLKETEESKEFLENQEKKKEKERKEQERKQQQKLMVKEYKESKQQMEQFKENKQYEEEPRHRQFSLESKQRLQQKEELLIKKKQQQILQKELQKKDEELKKLKMLEGKSVKYVKVESKLHEKTVASEAQQRDKYDKPQDRFNDKSLNLAGGVKNYGKAIPQWRQGIQ